MVRVKSLQDAKKNYEDAASTVQSKYERGIDSADWATNASSDVAEQLYAEGVQRAVQRKARQNGVRKVTNEQWKARAKTKGAPNIGQAMRQSGDKWVSGYQPFADVLEGVNLPPRVADPVQNVTNRVIPIVKALADKKAQMQGG